MLIQTDVGRAEVVAKQLAELAGVLSAEYVTGPYDVVVRIGADSMSDLQDYVVPNVQQVAGITRTLTCPSPTEPAPRVALVAATTDSGGDGPPRSLMIAAVAVAVTAIVAVLAIALIRQSPSGPQPVPISSAPAPRAESAECGALVAALPDELGDYRRAPAADPAPTGAAAWRAASDAEPVLLRAAWTAGRFVVGAPIQVVDAVQWFEVGDEGRSTWFAVDRPVHIALTLPRGSGPTPIQQISEVVARTLPAKPVDPAPVR